MKMKRFLASLLVLCMAFTCLPMAARAEAAEEIPWEVYLDAPGSYTAIGDQKFYWTVPENGTYSFTITTETDWSYWGYIGGYGMVWGEYGNEEAYSPTFTITVEAGATIMMNISHLTDEKGEVDFTFTFEPDGTGTGGYVIESTHQVSGDGSWENPYVYATIEDFVADWTNRKVPESGQIFITAPLGGQTLTVKARYTNPDFQDMPWVDWQVRINYLDADGEIYDDYRSVFAMYEDPPVDTFTFDAAAFEELTQMPSYKEDYTLLDEPWQEGSMVTISMFGPASSPYFMVLDMIVASNTLTTSMAAVDIIKSFEGFYAYPYYSGGGYYIGYGTACDPDDYPNGITSEEAELLLLAYLSKFEEAVCNFAASNNLTLTQNQFDALMCFTYNLGTTWTNSGGIFSNAVAEGKTGNDFIYAITLYSKVNGLYFSGLVKRRLAEAAMYLDGIYSITPPDNYTYVLFDPCGGVVINGIQGYDTTHPDTIRATTSNSGYRFLGWYTQEISGAWITNLDARTRKATLYAHWQLGEGNVDEYGNILGTAASYTRVSRNPLNKHNAPDAESDVTGTVSAGEVIIVVADYVSADGIKWGKLPDGSWVNLTDTVWIILGDLNIDGEVDIFDANLIVAYYNGTADLTAEQLAAADLNGNGDVDIFDANLVVSYYNGTIVSFPVEE